MDMLTDMFGISEDLLDAPKKALRRCGVSEDHIMKPFLALKGHQVRVIMIDEKPVKLKSSIGPFAWSHAMTHFESHVRVSSDWPESWAAQGVLMIHANWIEDCKEEDGFVELTKAIIQAIIADPEKSVVCVALGAYARSLLSPLCEVFGVYLVNAPSPFYASSTSSSTSSSTCTSGSSGTSTSTRSTTCSATSSGISSSIRSGTCSSTASGTCSSTPS